VQAEKLREPRRAPAETLVDAPLDEASVEVHSRHEVLQSYALTKRAWLLSFQSDCNHAITQHA
jgi:hypothetical protein